MKKFIEFFIKRSLLVNIIAVIIMLAGLFFMLTVRRVAFPEVQFDIAFVYTIYPGASPLEVERNVTRPVEERIKGISGIKEMLSSSRSGYSGVFIELETDLDNPESTINDIRQAVDTVEDLPDLAEKPVVMRIGSSIVFPALGVNLTSPDASAEKLNDLADELERKILKVPGVSHVNFSGYDEPEIKVDIDPALLNHFHLSVREIVNAIRTHVISYPAGTLDEGDTQVMVSLNSRIMNASDVGNVVVRSNFEGYTIRVKDVAGVHEGVADTSYLFRTNGKKSVNLQIMKMKSGDNILISRRVKEICEEFEKEKNGSGVKVKTEIVDDVSDFIKNRLDVVKNNAVIGLFLVVLSLFLFLNWRVALFTAAGLPVAFGVTFIIMGYAGITINMMSMVGMILVLGMLVDDAIIVAENIYRHMEHGMKRLEAVVTGTSEVVAPVTGTVLTTIAAFIPLFLITGMMGKFMIHMPIIVIIALAASLIEAVIILPVHAYDFAEVSDREMEKARGEHDSKFHRFREMYRNLLEKFVRNRYVVLGAAMFVLVALFTYFGTVQISKFEMMPSEGIEIFFMKYELPSGTRKERTLEEVKKIENILKSELSKNELRDFVVRIGSDETHSFVHNEGEAYGIAIVYLTDISDRERDVQEIIDALREKTDQLVKQGTFLSIRYEKVKPGPPTGPPVSVEIECEDFTQSRQLADEVVAFLKTIDGVLQVETSYGKTVDEVEVVVDSEKAHKAGLTAIEVAEFLRAAFEGIEASSVKKGEKEVEIRVRLQEGWASDRESIKELRIENRMGNLIPLGAIAHLRSEKSMQAVFHDKGNRYISVMGEIDALKVRPGEIAEKVQEHFKGYEEKYPDTELKLGGEVEETRDFFIDIVKALLLAVSLIFIILASIFNSPFHPFLVLLSIPFAFAGVILAFFLHGETFTMVAIIGVVGMTGVVVNDAIVLVSYIRQLRLKGTAKLDSIITGGVTRLRPVILTSLTTLLGLAPTAYHFGGKDPFLPVIALAIGWGLLFSTGVTLLLIPCFYAIGDDVNQMWWRWRKGK